MGDIDLKKETDRYSRDRECESRRGRVDIEIYAGEQSSSLLRELLPFQFIYNQMKRKTQIEKYGESKRDSQTNRQTNRHMKIKRQIHIGNTRRIKKQLWIETSNRDEMKKRNRKGKPKDEINLGQRITTERDMIDGGSSKFSPAVSMCSPLYFSRTHPSERD